MDSFKVLIAITRFPLTLYHQFSYTIATYPLQIISASTVITKAKGWLQVFATKELMYSINCMVIGNINKVRQYYQYKNAS